MGNMKRQGGSVAGFIVIGTILVLVSFGVLYGMKHIAMRDQSPPMALPGLASNDRNHSDGSKNGANSNNSDDTNTTPKDEAPSANTEQKNPGSTGLDSPKDKSNSTGSQSSPQDGKGLPQSGPTDGPAGMLAAVAITSSLTAYIRSNRRF